MKAKKNIHHARVNYPIRHQVTMQFLSLDQMLPVDHVARIVVAYVETLDTSSLYERIVVSANQAGRTCTNPEVLLSLWLLGTIEGIGSARELTRRSTRDIPYIWICGEIPVNRTNLADFRIDAGEFLDRLLVDTVTSLIDSGIVSLDVVAQDGMRVRASAGKSSFRRAPTLEKLRDEVQSFVESLKDQEKTEKSVDAETRRQSAKKRAMEDRLNRLEDSLEQVKELSARREKRTKGEGEKTRCSTTDPDARNMKMANGGYNPAFNVQFATVGEARMIVEVDVTNEGTDGGELEPMVEQIQSDYGQVPTKVLADGAYATKPGVTATEKLGTQVISTVPRVNQLAKHGKNAYEKQKGDTEQYTAFRSRMQEPENIELYKLRPSIAEFPNAVCRNRGLQQFNVRGLAKAKAVALWHAIAFNFTRMRSLGVIK